jgi:Ca2+-binding EF-hand superfamily protein
MATEFQRRKIAPVFGAMDADHDGFLDETDFHALTARWTTTDGCAPGSARHHRITEIAMGWWTTLSAIAGSDRVDLEQVLLLVDRLGTMRQAVTTTAATMFEAVDGDGDGWISAGEYRALVEAWSGAMADTDEVFALLDTDGDGRLSLAEFTEAWIEFWAGDDPTAPGSRVFGHG